MSPVISNESGTTLRNRLNRSIVLAIRNLMQQAKPDNKSLDLAAYVVLALEKVAESVDSSAKAWEKREYWIKADQFRMEHEWVGALQLKLSAVLKKQDWSEIAITLAQVAQHLQKVEVSPNNRVGEPWVGAWAEFQKRN